MKIKEIPGEFTVCKVEEYSPGMLDCEYCFVGKTDEERSLVCLTRDVPNNTIERDDHWRAFRIEGVLDFSLVGILARISTLLADNEIGLFAISTFNTDYILTKSHNFARALAVLAQAGYEVE